MYKIIVIGIGNLGKRHVQSLLMSNLDMHIECVDVVDVNFEEIKSMPQTGVKELEFYNDLQSVGIEYDLAIIATSSAVRKRMFFELLTGRVIHNIIFEKVLFQKIEDYYDVKKALDECKINAWVNCARREWDSWSTLKEELDNEEILSFDITGTNWGFGCNSIHMLDIISFFDSTIELTYFDFGNIKESKRSGYKELDGCLIGKGERCKSFSISCFEGENVTMSMCISTCNRRIIIHEGAGKKVEISLKGGEVKNDDFVVEYQSGLTKKSVENILLNGETQLPHFDESMNEHLQIIKPMIEYFEKNGGEKKLCPIT